MEITGFRYLNLEFRDLRLKFWSSGIGIDFGRRFVLGYGGDQVNKCRPLVIKVHEDMAHFLQTNVSLAEETF